MVDGVSLPGKREKEEKEARKREHPGRSSAREGDGQVIE